MNKNSLLTTVALAMILGLTACEPRSAATSVLPTPVSVLPTATLLPSPTWTPTAEPSPTPTNTPTPTQSPPLCPTTTPDESVGQILFSARKCDRDCEPFAGDIAPLYIINSDGSGMRQIYTGRGVIEDMQLSPDGTKLAFTDSYYVDISEQRYSSWGISVLDLASERVWALSSDDTSQKAWGARWVSDETLVYASSAIEPTDISSNIYLTDITGTWRQQLTNRQVGRTSIPDIAVSPDGTQLVFAEFVLNSDTTTVYRMNTDGTSLIKLITFLPGMRDANVAWSPTGDWIVIYSIPLPISPVPVYLAEPDRAEVRKITELPGRPSLLAWTEDQTGLVFYVCSGTLGTNEIVEVRSDGSVRLLVTGEGRIPTCPFLGSLSPDRKWFAFSTSKELSMIELSDNCHYQILQGYQVSSILWLPENTPPQFQP